MNQRLQVALARATVFSLGAYHTCIGIFMFALPQGFYKTLGNIPPFPPYNRHYIADFGAYQLPLGIALLIASRRPFQHRLLIGAIVTGNILHALNHVFDDLSAGMSLSLTTIGLLLMGFLYLFLVAAQHRTRQSD